MLSLSGLGVSSIRINSQLPTSHYELEINSGSAKLTFAGKKHLNHARRWTHHRLAKSEHEEVSYFPTLWKSYKEIWNKKSASIAEKVFSFLFLPLLLLSYQYQPFLFQRVGLAKELGNHRQPIGPLELQQDEFSKRLRKHIEEPSEKEYALEEPASRDFFRRRSQETFWTFFATRNLVDATVHLDPHFTNPDPFRKGGYNGYFMPDPPPKLNVWERFCLKHIFKTVPIWELKEPPKPPPPLSFLDPETGKFILPKKLNKEDIESIQKSSLSTP